MYKSRPIADVLTFSRAKADIVPTATYKLVTVRLFGRGIEERSEVLGSNAGSAIFYVRSGQLLLSRIDAGNGAIALVPPALNGALVTQDFWSFDVDESVALRRYVELLTRDPVFVQACRRASKGTTNRRRLQEDLFNSIEVPIPPLGRQAEIVQRADAIHQRLSGVRTALELQDSSDIGYRAAVEALVQSVPAEKNGVDNLLARYRDKYMTNATTAVNSAKPGAEARALVGPYALPKGWSWAPVSSLCTHIVDCVNDTPNFLDDRSEYVGLKTTNVRLNRLDLDEQWFVSEHDYHHWNRRLEPIAGDIILTREAPMGMVALIPEGIRACLTQRLMILRVDPLFVAPQFLVHMMCGNYFLKQAEAVTRSTPPHLRVQDLPQLLVPICDHKTQLQVSERLDQIFSRFRRLHALSSEQAEDLGNLAERFFSSLV